MIEQTFHERLKYLMDQLAHSVYDSTENFPKDEIFGLTSQLRRSSLSVILNYIEGYARKRKLIYKNFLEISYGSLQETKYLTSFSYKRRFLNETQYKKINE